MAEQWLYAFSCMACGTWKSDLSSHMWVGDIQSLATMPTKRKAVLFGLVATGLFANPCHSKHFEKCELAKELLRLGLPQEQLNDCE